jgi:hypothetical protein
MANYIPGLTILDQTNSTYFSMLKRDAAKIANFNSSATSLGFCAVMTIARWRGCNAMKGKISRSNSFLRQFDRGDVPQEDHAILLTGGQRLAVGTECHCVHPTRMALEHGEFFAGLGVP